MTPKKIAAASALLVLTTAPAFAAVGLDANLELDSTYVNQGQGLSQGGRVEANLSAKGEEGGSFVAARGTLLIKKDGTTGTDDMWVQAGNANADIKLGRFEAADMFPLGKDVLVLGADTGYRTQTLRGRTSLFHAAGNVKFGPGMGLELGLIEAKPANQAGNAKGVRPVLSFGVGPVSLKVGAEAIKTAAGVSQTGVGVTGAFAFEGGSANLSVAKNSKADATGIGANVTLGNLGIGAIAGKTAGVKSDSVYAAYSFPLFGVKGATITPAVSSGKSGDGNRYSGARVRINYAF